MHGPTNTKFKNEWSIRCTA